MKTSFILALFFSFSVLAESEIKLNIRFSPAGSFQVMSKKLKGGLRKEGSKITADRLSVIMKSFTTGINLRDEHFWQHMNVDKHPKAILTDVVGEKGKATAQLEVNGVKRPVNISYIERGRKIVATFTVKASEFSLPEKSFLGIRVQDDVQVEATYPYKLRPTTPPASSPETAVSAPVSAPTSGTPPSP